MLKLYHAPRSRSSRFVWLLEEMGADYQIHYTNIERGDGSGGEDPENPHPDKKVPALVHDGELITESGAIALYLTDLFPESGLGPKSGDKTRGDYLTWLFYYAGVVEPVIAIEFSGLGDHPNLFRAFRGRAELDRRLLDHLKHGPFLLGDTFSAADVLYASIGMFSRQMMPAGKLVDDYLARCTSRPALKAAQAKDSPKK